MNMEEHEVRERVPWRREEEDKLRDYVITHGAHHWDTMARNLGIRRSGNSCRLKWVNYLKPDILRGAFTDQEILTILKLRYQGKGWSKIAKELPGRTDNNIKNFWNSRRMRKEAQQLNCEVKSQEFFNKMTAKLMDRIQLQTTTTHHAYSISTGGSGVTTDTLDVVSSGVVESWSAMSDYGSIGTTTNAADDESIWANLAPIYDNFSMDFNW